jgi:hypothetical protein
VKTHSRLDDRIRGLCAQAATADDANFSETLSELQTALHEHAEKLRDMAVRQAMRQMARRTTELVAKVQTEQDPRKYSAIVEELNRLLESDHPARKANGASA